MTTLKALSTITCVGLIWLVGSSVAIAQSFTSSGQNWSAGWGFPSTSDRSLAIQQAQAIRQAKIAPGPSSIVTTYNEVFSDNRSNYQEVVGEVLELGTIDFQLSGDRIGQNTNSIGSMNTGTTNIEVNGSGNEVVASNLAENKGCVDGSIQQETTAVESMQSLSGIDISVQSTGRDMRCAE